MRPCNRKSINIQEGGSGGRRGQLRFRAAMISFKFRCAPVAVFVRFGSFAVGHLDQSVFDGGDYGQRVGYFPL